LSDKKKSSDDHVLQWARSIVQQFSDTENKLYPHFLQLMEEYRHLLRSFNRVERISDGYQKSLMETNESLNQAARRDSLTGLSNRRCMMDQLSEETKRAKRYGHSVSAVLIDIDNFKNVNDTYGHGAGDKVLVSTAHIIRDSIRETDTAARWGGEEFLICLPHTDLHSAVTAAEKIRSAVEENYVSAEGKRISVTISAGVAQHRETIPVDDLIRSADDALYKAKAKGRNCVSSAE
jgi:diguanylate cyclase (GGDEF)-like protein